MIVTCKKSIPFRWMLIALLPWSALTISTQVTGNAVIFSLKKFLENPAALTFVLTLPAFLSVVTVTVTNFLSDRIWTRYGRRKPFVVVGFAGMVVCFFLMPLMPNFWSLVAVYILLVVFMDLDSPIEPLKQEIVPPHQRGRATGVMFWINQAAQLTFMFFIFGRFDDVRFMGGIPISGETGIYWCAGLMALTMLMLITLGTKEVRQKSRLTGEKLSVRTFFGGLVDRELLPVYILIFGAAVINADTGPMGALLATEQWGYTKQELGTNIAVGGCLNLVLIALLTIFADRLNRLRAYQILLLLAIGLRVGYWIYVHYVLPDQRPTLVEMIIFGEMMSVVGILTGLVYTPLIYDYVVRNKMGTYVAGAQLVTKLTNIVSANGAGLFIIGYAALFRPPAGEMTRIVLDKPSDAASVRAQLVQAGLTDPASGQPADAKGINVTVWNGDGTVASRGQALEVRLKNPSSEDLAAERTALTQKYNPLLEREKLLKERLDMAERASSGGKAASIRSELEALRPPLEELASQIRAIEGKLLDRAQSLQDQAGRALAGSLFRQGEQIVSAGPAPLLLIVFPIEKSPSRARLERLLVEARETIPGLVDLRVVPGRMELEASFRLDRAGAGPDDAAREAAGLAAAARKAYPALLAPNVQPSSFREVSGAVLTLATVERPVPQRISPVTRAIHWIQSHFGWEPPADARVVAAARALRTDAGTPHVGARPAADGRHEITFTFLPSGSAEAGPASAGDEAIAARLAALLASSTSPGDAVGYQALYERAKLALAKQGLTVCEPFLAKSFAPAKYDYMATIPLTVILGCIGFGITMVFYRLDRLGVIRKRGLEEAQATE